MRGFVLKTTNFVFKTMKFVFKMTGKAKDTDVAREKRSQGTQNCDYDDEDEGAGLLSRGSVGGGDSEVAPNWDPDYRSSCDRKVVLARPKDAAAGVM